MNRAELADNVAVSAEMAEVVTLLVEPISDVRGDQVITGRMLALAERYAGGRAPQAVLRLDDGTVLVVGLRMIKDFAVGRRLG